jgi:hypothetical protein
MNDKLSGIRRKLTLMRAKQDFETKRITRAQYNAILDAANNPIPSSSTDAMHGVSSNQSEQSKPELSEGKPALTLDEGYLKSLFDRRDKILSQKAALSNSLRFIPREKSAKTTTDEILRLRDEFSKTQELIRQYQSTGKKPEELQKEAIHASVPSDKYSLDKAIKATKKRIKYAEDALRTAKDPGIRMRHEVNLAQDNMLLDALLNKFRDED